MAYSITCRQWQESDLSNLLLYLHHLKAETQDRFGPHPFTREALDHLYHHPDYKGFVLIENNSTYIIGYAIVKMGFLEHDHPRLLGYHFQPDHISDATYAPSLADDWQGKGIGNLLWDTVKAYLQHSNKKRVILWGGVQTNNTIAVKYYQKNNFIPIGSYTYNGKENIDMICTL